MGIRRAILNYLAQMHLYYNDLQFESFVVFDRGFVHVGVYPLQLLPWLLQLLLIHEQTPYHQSLHLTLKLTRL